MTYERLKQLKDQRGIKLKELAKATGISYEIMKNWGRGKKMTESDLLLVARYFDVSVDYLLGNTNDPQSHKSGSTKTLEILKDVRSFIDQRIENLMAEKTDNK